MGVPKFYRWLSERYPKINQIVTDTTLLPEFDHLYLDMNGIIHGCTHPAHMDVSDVLSERDMMLGIMHYLDRIITQIVKPKVSVFLAIDGVAPRAKLNQQRSRRFRSAKDLAEALEEKKKNDEQQQQESNNNKDVFDSNCITPGTEFMDKVSSMIRYWIRSKLQTDPSWSQLKVIFSGPEVPGEGEHKIMQHIRDLKSQPDYPPNTRHVMYGQDADLIMLGLVTHEPHFTLLREIVQFGMPRPQGGVQAVKSVKRFTKESDFQLLHLSVLREYLQLEFCKNNSSSSSGDDDGADTTPDLERIVDDFVFITFFVGNDFLPHLPALDIGDGAFDLLFRTYTEERTNHWGPGEYLVYKGEVCDRNRLERFIAKIGAHENEILAQKEDDDATFVQKQRRWAKRDFGHTEGIPTDADLRKSESAKEQSYREMMAALPAGRETVAGWTPPRDGAKDYKGRYYYEKLQLTPCHMEEHRALRQSYVEGLLWCLAYYYKGCVSWSWFFPYHYGPMLSDLVELDTYGDLTFELGRPLLPFEQLMGCLPPASASLLPKPYRVLMTSPMSKIVNFYPTSFTVDMNGKRNPWEGVNLLPFIDSSLLKSTLKECVPPSALSVLERKRNQFGPVDLYLPNLSETETVVKCPNPTLAAAAGSSSSSSHNLLPDLQAPIQSTVTYLDDTSFQHVPTTCFAPTLVQGTQIPYPGFPSLHVLPIASHSLDAVGLNCFGSPSKYPNCVVTLHNLPTDILPPLQDLAESILGKSVYINWPMMHEAQVVGLTNETGRVVLNTNKGKKKKKKDNTNNKATTTTTTTFQPFTAQQSDKWRKESEQMKQQYHLGTGVPGSGGVVICGDDDDDNRMIPYRLECLPLQGMKTIASSGATKKVWASSHVADIPLQLALWNAPAPDPRFMERAAPSLVERFPLSSNVLFVQGKYKGTLGKVVATTPDGKVGVECQPSSSLVEGDKGGANNNGIDSFGRRLVQAVQQQTTYVPSHEAASILKLSPQIFGKIMGSLQIQIHGQAIHDIGLNLKYASSEAQLYVVGYTRAKPSSNGNNNNKKRSTTNPWKAGDSLQVVGSDITTTENNNNDDIIKWEYTPRAIKLVHTYRQAFPLLFQFLASNPSTLKGGRPGQVRPYNATHMLQGKLDLSKVQTYLQGIETTHLPRTPLTTQALPREAIWAIQKASDLLSAASGKQQKSTKENSLLVKVPPAALYRYGSTTAVSLLDFSNNNNAPPRLGDRIVNVCANGIPFGLKGTIVGIHSAQSGCVEVVMDTEFVGGGTLQGATSGFRGKLCWYNHLLKLSTTNDDNGDNKKQSDNDDDDDKTPSSSTTTSTTNHQNVDDIVAKLKQELNPTTNTKPKNAWGNNNNNKQQQQQQQQQPVWNNNNNNTTTTTTSPMRPKSRPRSTGRHNNNRSTGTRGANNTNVLWKEAKKPSEHDVGFRGKRKSSKSGFQRWKSLLQKRQEGTLELRALLGVMPNITTSTTTSTKQEQEQQQQEVVVVPKNETTTTMKNQQAAAGLKALLGVPQPPNVGSSTGGVMPLLPPRNVGMTPNCTTNTTTAMPIPPPPPPPPPHMMMQSSPPPTPYSQALMNAPIMTPAPGALQYHPQMMQSPPRQQPPPPQQQSSSSSSAAADKLLQMMRQPQQPPPLSNNNQQQQEHSSTFNFTYVQQDPK